MTPSLNWLPQLSTWREELLSAGSLAPEQALATFVKLANSCIDFAQTAKLDRAIQKMAGYVRESMPQGRRVRLAVLSSSTVAHLVPAIRVGALRRGLWVDVHEGDYGMYRQELQDQGSALHEFRPDAVLFSFDAHHLFDMEGASVQQALERVETCWKLAKQAFPCTVIQQTVLPVFLPTLGNNEPRDPSSRLSMCIQFNDELRRRTSTSDVNLLAIDSLAAQHGVAEFFEAALWHRSKQEIHPRVSHVYGDQVGRLLAALRGASYKCLVMDLDNTLWGGVIGDDGMDGIVLGQGTAAGESFVAFQKYALQLSRNGVILAVCSKNDEHNALQAFEQHPEMILRRKHIACFAANWNDKASNLSYIAKTLNIGLDSLVFADDNPFERNLIRQEHPSVAVPELPEDPALYAACLADGGYFERLSVTDADRERSGQYQANAEREQLRESATDLNGYLISLNMELVWSALDPVGVSRFTQLINKTNQFNLTTKRYNEAEVRAMLNDPTHVLMQFRLIDRFGDNGIIAIVIGRLDTPECLILDTWLMSCRVLGRQVEEATLNVIAERAREMGAHALVGQFSPTKKNGMVKDHYTKLGFSAAAPSADSLAQWTLDIGSFEPKDILMKVTGKSI